MRRFLSMRFFACALLLCLFQWATPRPALAYNFTYVDPDIGEPIGWEPGTTIEYYLDPGAAGVLTNDQAHTLLKEAMAIWESVPYANVPHFEFAGYLPEDVNGDNYQAYVSLDQCYTSDLESCPTEPYKNLKTLIIFDPDNAILDNEFCRISGCSSNAGPKVFDGYFSNRGSFRQGIAVFGNKLNSDNTVEIVGTFVHELGHLLGLAHPSLNQQLYGNDIDSIEDASIFLASMDTNLPWSRDNLNPDDIAGLSTLYPNERFLAELGSIRGEVQKSDGSPMTHANVIARDIEDSWCKAYSILTGISCSGPTLESCEDFSLADGSFLLGGLPPGAYTLEVEGFEDPEYAFTVAPGLVDPYIPGEAEYWNENDLPDEDPLAYTVINVSAGTTNDSIIFVLRDTQYSQDYDPFLAASVIGPLVQSSCAKSTTDWDGLIGRDNQDDSSSTSSGPAGGCSLIPR